MIPTMGESITDGAIRYVIKLKLSENNEMYNIDRMGTINLVSL
jgi:hypothetical protein